MGKVLKPPVKGWVKSAPVQMMGKKRASFILFLALDGVHDAHHLERLGD